MDATNQFRVFTETIRGAEGNQVTQYVLHVNGQKFSFIPPNGWNVMADRTKRTITLLPQDLKAGITVTFNSEPDGATPELKRDELREKILERYPGAHLTREFEIANLGLSGLGFDLVRFLEKDTKAGTRIVFASYAGGAVEFELTTAADRFADYHVPFGRMLNSFHIGKVTVKE